MSYIQRNNPIIMNTYVVGLDYGTDSVRAVLVDTSNGKEITDSVFAYPRWKDGLYCNPGINQFRQHPSDHIEGLEYTVKTALNKAQIPASQVKAICVDTTGSSPIPMDVNGIPLALVPGFEDNPNAMMVLWKDHTSVNEAEEINTLARSWGGEDYTKYEGGIYSSEWFWAKILHIVREDPVLRNAAHTWMEHCDLMPFLLTGGGDMTSVKRSRCAAGHKAMWHESWGGLPSKDFLDLLDSYLGSLRERLYSDTYTSDQVAGTLCPEWAQRLGLTPETIIAVGTFDAHAGAVGARIGPGTLVRVMGTSTCDMIVAPKNSLHNKTVKGICGQVNGSIVPGMVGLEAGQSAFGDLLAWFKDLLSWPLDRLVYGSAVLSDNQIIELRQEVEARFMAKITEEAAKIPLDEGLPVALDWINGRRTPDADQGLKSALYKISLGTDAPRIFMALVHAICFGSKKIVERFESEGVAIDSVVGIGGVARKSEYIMQTLANVLDRPIRVAASDQAPALGAAIYAAVAGGIYNTVETAMAKMGSPVEAEYLPDPKAVKIMRGLMADYDALADFVVGQHLKINHGS